MSLTKAILTASLCLALSGAAMAQQTAVAVGKGAVLRGLDKVNAQVSDIEVRNGGSVEFGRLEVRLLECRYPQDDAAADAFAYLAIRDIHDDETVFSGWMMASSPALNALEHPRYDVWVLRCITE